MKKITAIILCLLLTNSISVFSEEKTTDLKKYGVTVFDTVENEYITRSEFCRAVCEIMGYSEPTDVISDELFSDVSVSHKNYKYIAFAKSAGIVNGYLNGEFLPDSRITYKETLKMLVCVLGYGVKAEAREPYPIGYIKTATEINLAYETDNFEKCISVNEAVTLFNTALDIPLLQNTSFGKDMTYTVMDGKNGVPLVTLKTKFENR